MGYQIVPANTNKTNTTKLGIEMNFNANGVFKSVTESDIQALNNLKNLLLTRIGERYENPLFGTNLLNIIFQPSTSDTKIDINDIITTAVNYWLPEITLIKIDIITAEDDPSQEHDIDVSITFQASTENENNLNIQANENGTLVVKG
jgi:phage baseplate assembly protein W